MFQWGCKLQKTFDTLKEKISTAPLLALPDIQRPFEIETDASDYAMGVVLTKHGKPICYHFETFNFAVVNYPTYDKELYALVQSVKKWKHYLMGKEAIIHTDHVGLYGPDPRSEELFSQTNPAATGPFSNNPRSAD